MIKASFAVFTASILLLLALAPACATAPATSSSAAARPEPISPADLVLSIADVATGKNAAMAEAGLVLKRIEFKLAVGRQTEGGGKVEILLLDAEASRSTETAFLQEFTLELPAEGRRGVTAPSRPLVPGVREFLDAAMDTARDLARAATEAGLPQRLRNVELTAKLTRSRKLGGGIAATFPALLAWRPSIGVDASKSLEEENTLHLVFEVPRL